MVEPLVRSGARLLVGRARLPVGRALAATARLLAVALHFRASRRGTGKTPRMALAVSTGMVPETRAVMAAVAGLLSLHRRVGTVQQLLILLRVLPSERRPLPRPPLRRLRWRFV